MQNIFFRILTEFRFEKKNKPFHINFTSHISLKMDILDLIYLNNVSNAHWAQYAIAYLRCFFP